MQIFQVNELKEFPHMEIQEILEGEIVSDIFAEIATKAYLIVDHEMKKIWMYNGQECPLKKQIYCGISAEMMKKQLRLFYRVDSLNVRSKNDDVFREIMNKALGSGKAKPFEKSEFSELTLDRSNKPILSIHSGINVNDVIERLKEISQPEDFTRKFMIIGGIIFIEEEETKSFVKEERVEIKPVKLSKLNNGFTFFDDRNYSTRFIIKDRKLQSIELYVSNDEKDDILELKIPIIKEEKFSNIGKINDLFDAFQIPDKLADDEIPEDQLNSE